MRELMGKSLAGLSVSVGRAHGSDTLGQWRVTTVKVVWRLRGGSNWVTVL